MHSYTFYYTLHLVTNPIKSLGTPKNIHYKKQFSKKNEKWFHGNFVCVRVNLRKYHTVHCVLIWNKFRESNIFTKWKLLVVDLTNHFFGQSKFFIFTHTVFYTKKLRDFSPTNYCKLISRHIYQSTHLYYTVWKMRKTVTLF